MAPSVILLFTIFLSVSCEYPDGGKAPRIPLNDGNHIPHMGLGTFLGFDENGQKSVDPRAVEIPVSWALDAGYRLIDTAALYHNEDQIGAAVHASNVPRENIFVVTKLPMDNQRDPVARLQESLSRLNLSYVDLYLIHNPIAFKPGMKSGYDIVDYVDTWKGMEQTKKLGLAKSIGISNFNTSQIDRLLAQAEITPAVLEVEMNLNLAQKKLLDYCKEKNIVMMAFTPFGSMYEKHGVSLPPRADDPTLVGIADNHKKTSAQIALRYLIQKGAVPIPKSSNKHRIEQNIDVFDFEISPEEMETLDKFNKNQRTVGMSFWQDHPYFPFEKSDAVGDNPFKP